MANPEHMKILKQGVGMWNEWKNLDQELKETDGIDLSHADLSGRDLSTINFSEVKLDNVNFKGSCLEFSNFRGSNLSRACLSLASLYGADLRGADLSKANLSEAILCKTDLRDTNLEGAILLKANLSKANLSFANLQQGNLSETDLKLTNFTRANLDRANFLGATCYATILVAVNMATVENLESCHHDGPSFLDISTLMASPNLPKAFLQGCGLPENFIAYLPSLIQGPPLQFYSCFISHSTKDQPFAERLYSDLKKAGVKCYYAPEKLKGGEKIYDQIDSAICFHDKLLLVLSEDSLASEWVTTEIRRCRKAEKREGKRKLFPIRLVDMETIQEWECFDADTGKDLAVEAREFFIPDFSHWKDHDSYNKAFDRLLRDLKESAE